MFLESIDMSMPEKNLGLFNSLDNILKNVMALQNLKTILIEQVCIIKLNLLTIKSHCKKINQ